MEPSSESIRDLVALLVALILCSLSGALNTARLTFRVTSALLVALTLLTPWIASTDSSFVRALCGCVGILALFRNVDLLRDRHAWGPVRRAIHAISVVDSRWMKLGEPNIANAPWLRFGAFGLATALTTRFLNSAPIPEVPADYIPRWTAGTLWVYCSIETLAAFVAASGNLVGIDPPILHNNPLLSRSLSEFWGRRWNLSIHAMLLEHCFRPASRKLTPLAATSVAFAASAAIHFWITLAACGPTMATSMAMFFLVQAGLMAIERRISVRRWWRALQRIWTVACLLTTLPLLLEPLLQIIF